MTPQPKQKLVVDGRKIIDQYRVGFPTRRPPTAVLGFETSKRTKAVIYFRRLFEQDQIVLNTGTWVGFLELRRIYWQNSGRAHIEILAEFSDHLRLQGMASRVQSWVEGSYAGGESESQVKQT
jgi:hypothetical protein